VRAYDEEIVVFNPYNWQTHVLNAAAALVFEAFERQPLGMPDLLQFIHENYGAEAASVLDESSLRRLIEELVSLRLIQSETVSV
jgi:PqqD family protein of HPr-rel-A system